MLQAASLLDILEDAVDQAVSYFAIFELRFAGFCPPRTQMNLGPDVRSSCRSILGSVSES